MRFLSLETKFKSRHSKAHFTLGVHAKGQGESRAPIGWELKANPKSFRLGVKANN